MPGFKSREINVGGVRIGGQQPLVVQSMTTTDTLDVEKTVTQIRDLVNVGCQIVRITAPTIQDAEALKAIRERLDQLHVKVPLVADIHFIPAAAMVAADYVDKVRINPGNYADRKMFKTREYTDAEYNQELERIHEKFTPLVLKLKSLGRALRIGTNHGSLSDRIMNRFGDTPEGMVESALEFAEICRQHDFHNFCFSMKASNVGVMVAAYRLLVQRQIERGWDYPLHLGVTEAGDGEDGRMKSSLGIGCLLAEGIGDTIRVSLTESPVKEIPVAQAIADRFPRTKDPEPPTYNIVGTNSIETPEVWFELTDWEDLKLQAKNSTLRPDVIFIPQIESFESEAHFLKLQLRSILQQPSLKLAVRKGESWYEDERRRRKILAVADYLVVEDLAEETSGMPPIIFAHSTSELKNDPAIDPSSTVIAWTPDATARLSSLDFVVDASLQGGLAWVDMSLRGIMIRETPFEESLRTSFGLLQASRRRMSKTEYISCPSCGRTLFDLEETTARIKSVTSHLKGVKIAVMGCIVNGPGEMADADFGYVGGAPGRVNLYVGKECVERNIPSPEAPGRLVDLIKNHGKWVEPESIRAS